MTQRNTKLFNVINATLAQRGLAYNEKHPDYAGNDANETWRNVEFIESEDMNYAYDYDLDDTADMQEAVNEWIEDTLSGEPKYLKRIKV